MCGLAGVLSTDGLSAAELTCAVERMLVPITHRGPDDHGSWSDPDGGVALGLRRLAIVDLSDQGHQPMHSGSGRFSVAFNGEVYNHVELRRELESHGHRFRGHSDTEVMLAAFEQWGVEAAVQRFIGMFAIALWDRSLRRLFLIRDRLGIKPLFVYQHMGLVSFASEIKALQVGPHFDRTIDQEALTAYLRYLYVPAPYTIFRHVTKLLPGHILTLEDAGRPLPASRPFWSMQEVARRGVANRFPGSDEEAVDEGERLLRDAVSLRMRADVPVGAFLSGGIDSSLVVALMQAGTSRRVRTYTIGFEERQFDEAPAAARIAQHLGTDHTECLFTGRDALALVPKLAETFDEPFADPSQLPTLLVCELARRDVTVALSGDGGDELFAGYNRYTAGERMLGGVVRLPPRARHLLATGLTGVSRQGWDRAYQAVAPALPIRMRERWPGEKLHKVGRLLPLAGVPQMYRSLVSAWQEPELLVVDGREREDALERTLGLKGPLTLLERMMLADQVGYLPDDLLAKVDRASMAVSLEVRVPILDHRVAEFAWRLPRSQKVRGREGKWLLRQVLRRSVPPELFERPKSGFSVPLDGWLRGPLRSWGEELLTEESLRRTGGLRPGAVRAAWSDFQAGGPQPALGIWSILMFQAWHECWASAAGRA